MWHESPNTTCGHLGQSKLVCSETEANKTGNESAPTPPAIPSQDGQILLGHESLDTTSRYLGLMKDEIKAEYDRAMEWVLAGRED